MWPLEGIKVLDMTQNVAGPYASMILAEFGADVTKVEPPGGDATRSWGSPFWEGLSPVYLSINRNKKGVTIDIKTKEGKQKILEMLKTTDVVLVSSRPGAMERLGLDYNRVKEINPRIIYGEVTAFGNHGPRCTEPGYDPLMQAMAGLMSVTGHQGQDPVRSGTSIIDMSTGMWLATGVMGALQLREKTGHGHRVTSSLYETAVSWMSYHLAGYWACGQPSNKWGSGNAMICPYEAFPTKDKFVIIAAGNDQLFEKLCVLLDHEEWVTDPRFDTNANRVDHRDELCSLISNITKTRSSEYWISQLKEIGIPAAPVLDVAEMSKEPQLEASGIIQTIEHPILSEFKSVGLPVVINGQRPPLRMPPPV